MAIFSTNEEALIYILLIGIGLYAINKLLSFGLGHIKKILPRRKNEINFTLRLISIVVFVYFLVDGFPSFEDIPPEYTAIITSSLSFAIAFATSEIFSNFICGILIWILDPFDIGDIVKIQGHKGVIKSNTLTKVVIETFDRIIVEISNSDILSSNVLNYTIKLKEMKNYYQFRRKIQSPQQIGNARLNFDLFDEDIGKQEEIELRELHTQVLENNQTEIHTFNFSMRFPYERFRIKIDKVDRLCSKYKEIFGIKPQFHIFDFSNEISVKFRLLTLDSYKLLNNQAEFANDLYKIILEK
jgi:small-conductance mechanosensitive channel